MDFSRKGSSRFRLEGKGYLMRRNMVVELYGGVVIRIAGVFPERREVEDGYLVEVGEDEVEEFAELGKFILDEKYPERKVEEERIRVEKMKFEEEKRKAEEEERIKVEAKKSKRKKKKTPVEK